MRSEPIPQRNDCTEIIIIIIITNPTAFTFRSRPSYLPSHKASLPLSSNRGTYVNNLSRVVTWKWNLKAKPHTVQYHCIIEYTSSTDMVSMEPSTSRSRCSDADFNCVTLSLWLCRVSSVSCPISCCTVRLSSSHWLAVCRCRSALILSISANTRLSLSNDSLDNSASTLANC